ncbi:hypothetical protein [Viridibacillus arvi]|uniref:hypothetical protein n=1 Tax=Viridibacillus arvi TaxID=263475 RepID=UPI0034CF55C8
MKVLQFIGTKDKADFSLYFANVLSLLGKRVLIVDATTNQIYRNGYALLSENETIGDIQNVEILTRAKDWSEVEYELNKVGLKPENFDCIIIDLDSIQAVTASWPIVHDHYYLSDADRVHITMDIHLLNRLFDEYETTTIKRIHFESAFTLSEDYLDLLMNGRPQWHGFSQSVEYDDFEERLRLQMQHEQIIPLKQLSKSMRTTIESIVSEEFEIALSEIYKVTNKSFFGQFIKPKKIKAVEDSKIENEINSFSKKTKEITES